MGIAGNPAIEATPIRPPRTGLLASATVIESAAAATHSDASPATRWENGFSFAPEGTCDTGVGVADPCDNSNVKIADDPLGPVLNDPFVVWATDRCATFDRTRDRIGRARRKLLACQSKQIASELWTGTLAQAAGLPNQYLADAPTTVTTGAQSPLDALACIEGALAECSCTTGMVHVSPVVMTYLFAARALERFGNVFRTANDTLVVADAGYDGSSPAGAPGQWMYGTDLITVRLSAVSVIPSDDPDTFEAMTLSPSPDNSLTFLAERLASVSFDGCCLLAAETNVTPCT